MTKSHRLCHLSPQRDRNTKKDRRLSVWKIGAILSFFFVVKQTMAITLEIGVSYLLAEFLTHAFKIFRARNSARAVSAGAFKPLFYGIYNLFVFIKSYLHKNHLPSMNLTVFATHHYLYFSINVFACPPLLCFFTNSL